MLHLLPLSCFLHRRIACPERRTHLSVFITGEQHQRGYVGVEAIVRNPDLEEIVRLARNLPPRPEKRYRSFQLNLGTLLRPPHFFLQLGLCAGLRCVSGDLDQSGDGTEAVYLP